MAYKEEKGHVYTPTDVIGDYEYDKREPLGHGAFAIVYKGRSLKENNKWVAVKSITKKNIPKPSNLLSKEINILQELSCVKHPNIVELLECKETSSYVHLVMEYCDAGDLQGFILKKGQLSEETIHDFLVQIASAMQVLYTKGVVHRDLKPQNLLLCKPTAGNPQFTLKIADFGFARFLDEGVMAGTLCGSPMYMAPEVIMSQPYCHKADLWSIGTIIFQCLTMKAPFNANSPQQLKLFYEKNKKLVPSIPPGTSSDLRDLLLRLLKRDAKDRITFDDFFNHPFLRGKAAPSTGLTPPKRHSLSDTTNLGRHMAAAGLSASPPKRDPGSRDTKSPRRLSGSPRGSDFGVQGSPPHRHRRPETTRMATRAVDLRQEESGSPSPRSESPDDFLTVEKCSEKRPHSPLVEDFVLVPSSIPHDPSGLTLRGGKAPLAAEEDLETMYSDGSGNVRLNQGEGVVSYNRGEGQTSPSRPLTLGVQSPTSTTASKPIPVPSRRQRTISAGSTTSPASSPTSASTALRRHVTSPVSLRQYLPEEAALLRTGSEPRLEGVDLGSLSPPSVQFSVGTPPNSSGNWRRPSYSSPRSSTASPITAGSPLRRSGGSSPRLTNINVTAANPGSLPTILGSPTAHIPEGFTYPARPESSKPTHIPFGVTRVHTVPDQLGARFSTEGGRTEVARPVSEPGGFFRGTSLLSQQLMKAAFSGPNQPQGLEILRGAAGSGLGSPREHLPPGIAIPGMVGGDPGPGGRRSSLGPCFETSPPLSMLFPNSPPTFDDPTHYVAPELSEEAIMDDKHNEIMGKLNYVLDLVECLLTLVKTKATPFCHTCKQTEEIPDNLQPAFLEAQRTLEQLVLYVRTLHLLDKSIEFITAELKASNLQQSPSLIKVATQMTEHYQFCLRESRSLFAQLGKNYHIHLTPELIYATADKIIYNYAIEVSQSAAMDEWNGQNRDVFQRYTVAQVLLHSLSQQAYNPADRALLNKYKEFVEQRLMKLHSSTMIMS